MDQRRGMFAVFLGMLGDLGGQFEKVSHKEERKRHNPPPLPEARDLNLNHYNPSATGYRALYKHTPKKKRSKLKRIAKLKLFKELTKPVLQGPRRMKQFTLYIGEYTPNEAGKLIRTMHNKRMAMPPKW